MFPGFDVSAWDGHLVWMWQWSNLRFVGFYLAHSANATSSSWTEHWHDLRDLGWGIAAFWLPFGSTSISAMASADGAAHGRAAVERARGAKLERGAAIYLDIEAPVFGDPQSERGFVTYVSNWMRAVSDAGYLPGAYCSRLDAHRLRTGTEFSPFAPVWWPFSIPGTTRAHWDDTHFQLTPAVPSAWRVADPRPTSDDQQWPMDVNTIGCQYDWFNANRDQSIIHWPNARGAQDTSRDVDWDMSKVFDPAHPRAAVAYAMASDRDNVDQITGVALTGEVISPFERAVNGRFTIPRPLGLGPATTGPTPSAELDGFDSAGLAAVSRRAGHVDVFLLGQDGFVRTIWSNPQDRFPAHPWALHPPDALARKGSPIAAVSRTLDQIDVFYVDRSHQLVTQWWHPTALDWGRNRRVLTGSLVAGGSNVVALPAPHDGARPDDRLDVFYVSLDFNVPYPDPLPRATPQQISDRQARWNDAWRVVHATWSTRADWQLMAIAGISNVAAASGVAAVRDSGQTVHVIVQSRDRTRLVHGTLADAPQATWTVANGPGPLPVSENRPDWWTSLYVIALGERLLLFGMTGSGALAWATFERGAWSAITTGDVHFSPYRPLAFARRGANAVDIVGTSDAGGIVGRSLTVEQTGVVNLLAANALPS